MANQYCIQCGTLLPEDGVCLRCGAVYSFSDDGTLTIHPRKVKKVTAKTSVKKRIFAKRMADPHEADTQTIQLPEDVFSHSDHRVNTEQHRDWTVEEDYVSDYLILDNESGSYSNRVEDNDASQNEEPYIPVPPKPKKKGKGGALPFLFFIIAILTGVFVFLWFGSSDSEQESTTVPSASVSSSTTTQTTTQKDVPVFTASALQLEGGMIGNDRAIYNFDEESGWLTINYSGNAEIEWLLLPLIDGNRFSKRHLSLTSLMRNSFGLFEQELCESDYITSGLIKTIKLIAEEDGYESKTTYQFAVESGKLYKTYITETSDRWSTDNQSVNTEMNYSYNDKGYLTKITQKSQNSKSGIDSYYEEEMRYNDSGYLVEIAHKRSDGPWEESYTDTLKYSGNLLKSITPNDNTHGVLSYEYDEAGLLVKVREITHDPYENTELFITNTSSGDVKSIYITGIERGDTYTYSRT